MFAYTKTDYIPTVSRYVCWTSWARAPLLTLALWTRALQLLHASQTRPGRQKLVSDSGG